VSKQAVWGDQGGHIYFNDGRVEWFTDTTSPENQFTSRIDGKGTTKWKEAVSKTFTGKELPAK
jgi:hypothetical protein